MALWRWTDGLRPHKVIGGKLDGKVVSWSGYRHPEKGFEYTIPGVFSLVPFYDEADRMEPITGEEADMIDPVWEADQ